MSFLLIVTILLLVKYVSGTIYFVETFDNEKSLLENNKDKEMKEWVQLFNKYDLYTKENIEYSSSELKNLKKYYDNLIKKFFKTDKIWW